MSKWRKFAEIRGVHPDLASDASVNLESIFSTLLDQALEQETGKSALLFERRAFKYDEHPLFEFARHRSYEEEDGNLVTYYDNNVYYRISAEYRKRDS